MTEPAEDVVEVRPAPARPARHRRSAAIAALVVGVVVLASGITWAATRGGGSGAAAGGPALACPASVVGPGAVDGNGDPAPAVPAPPSAAGSDGRLVPAAAPDSVVLCEYGPPPSGVVIRGEVAPAGPAGGTPVPVPATTSASDAVPGVAPAVTATAPESIPVGSQAGSIDVPLGRSAEHAGGDDAVTVLVAALQQATVRTIDPGYTSCLSYSEDLRARYLVGLSYADGTVWVAGPDVCTGSTNGVTGSELDISGPVAAALDAGSGGVTVAPAGPDTSMPVVPPASSTPGPYASGDPGASASPGTSESPYPGDQNGTIVASCTDDDQPVTSPTDDTRLVPFVPIAVLVCHVPVTGEPTAVEESAGVAVALAGTLNTLPTLEPDTACTDIGSDTWRLVFTSHDTEVTVAVSRDGCPSASNGSRTVQADATLFTQLDALD